MSGYWGYRELGRFVERHGRELIKMFQVSRAEMPSYSTIRRVIMQLDYEQLTECLMSGLHNILIIKRVKCA